MTKEEREQLRHEQVIEKINNAKTIKDLPKVSYNDIAVFLSNNIRINNTKFPTSTYLPIVRAIIDCGMVTNKSIVDKLMEMIINNEVESATPEEYRNIDIWFVYIGKYIHVLSENETPEQKQNLEYKVIELLENKKINNILIEVREKDLKASNIIKQENLEKHKQIMKKINNCFSIDELPKVGSGDLNKKILRAVNDNGYFTKIKTSEISDISKAYLNGANYSEIEKLVYELCDGFFEEEDNIFMSLQILGSLMQDETIEYTVEEIKAKEARKLFIYKNDHDIMMENIKNADRIGQLPPDLTVSTLTSYLRGNTTIYSNDNKIKSKNIKRLSELLLKGYKFEDEIIKNEIKKIAEDVYPIDYEFASTALFNKLSKLPRTYYLVEEINAFQKKYNSIVDNTKFNYYLVENPKAPDSGGQFFDVYIGDDQVEIPEDITDRAVRDWIIKEKHPGFRRIGGNILPRGIKISKIFTVGRYGISSEEKEILDASKELEEIKKEKEKELRELNKIREEKENALKELEELKKKLVEVRNAISESISDYEEKAFNLYQQMLDNAELLKDPIDVNKELRKNS